MENLKDIPNPLEIDLVSFNVPYPADYGGVIEVFYKIKALHGLGVKIHLHCFDYGRGESQELEKLCETVNYYKRRGGFSGVFSPLPHIVKTRKSQKLLKNLSESNRPVLLEGIHCTHPLLDSRLERSRVIIRSHNLEHEYYKGLAKSTLCFWKKLFFQSEAKKLEKHESIVEKASAVACISEADCNHFNEKYSVLTQTITPFHPFEEVTSIEGKGDYVLIHGDLSVPENQKSVKWLIDEVVSKVNHRVVVAGKNPGRNLARKISKMENIELVSNPEKEEMDRLITNAHINLIHSFYPQGFKLKLLYSLYGGRFCVCNPEVLEDTGLKEACIVATTPKDFLSAINSAFQRPFSSEMVDARKKILEPFSNSVQALKLIRLLS